MKKKTNPLFWKYLFNPFYYIAGNKALLLGLMVLILLSVISSLTNTYFSGALGAQFGSSAQLTPLKIHVWYVFSGWVIFTVITYLLAKLFSKSAIRVVDFAGTLALSKTPLLIFALLGFIPATHLNIDVQSGIINISQIISEFNANINVISRYL